MIKISLGRYYLEHKPCKYQDPETKLCTIYDERLKTDLGCGNRCTTAKDLIDKKLMQRNCPYIKYYGVENYKSKLARFAGRRNEE